MAIQPGRLLGAVMGLLILAAVFLLPFSSSQSLYASASPLVSDLNIVQQSGNYSLIAADYVMIITLTLLVVAGLVGIFPLGTGVIGVVAMALFIVGPILIYPSLPSPSYGAGYYLVWLASIVSLAASFWHGRRDKNVVVNNDINVSSPPDSGPVRRT